MDINASHGLVSLPVLSTAFVWEICRYLVDRGFVQNMRKINVLLYDVIVHSKSIFCDADFILDEYFPF